MRRTKRFNRRQLYQSDRSGGGDEQSGEDAPERERPLVVPGGTPEENARGDDADACEQDDQCEPLRIRWCVFAPVCGSDRKRTEGGQRDECSTTPRLHVRVHTGG
ncbi:hypothetical protein [Haladaptatus pallidirubidus]|uniref:hypothetical protein n=1 Tax=Haladaptatus pallidirubidus TaxID=1008152 RepID=UPI0036F22CFC